MFLGNLTHLLKISDPFEVSTGVLQGDVFSPFLFIILVDFLIKITTADVDLKTIPSQEYFADDIALLETFILKAQAQLTNTVEVAKDLAWSYNKCT